MLILKFPHTQFKLVTSIINFKIEIRVFHDQILCKVFAFENLESRKLLNLETFPLSFFFPPLVVKGWGGHRDCPSPSVWYMKEDGVPRVGR